MRKLKNAPSSIAAALSIFVGHLENITGASLVPHGVSKVAPARKKRRKRRAKFAAPALGSLPKAAGAKATRKGRKRAKAKVAA